MTRNRFHTNLLALALLIALAAPEASAQFFHFGGVGGGVSIRAPFVAVDVDPWGGSRVRAPFTAVDSGFGYPPFGPVFGPTFGPTFGPAFGPPIGSAFRGGAFLSPFPSEDYHSYRYESYRYAPYGRSLPDYRLHDYDPRYDHYGDNRYDDDRYMHADDPPYYSQQAEDEFIERLYPSLSRQNRVIASAVPQPSFGRSSLEDQLLQAQAESLGAQRIYAAENLSATISDTTLARSAAQLADGLAAMGEEGIAWLDYLAPDEIVRWVDAGSPNNDLLVDLISAYDGVVSNPQLGWVTSMAGFRETRHQLHLRISYVDSPVAVSSADETRYPEDFGSSIMTAPPSDASKDPVRAKQQTDEPKSEAPAKPNADNQDTDNSDADVDFETLPLPAPKAEPETPVGI